MDFFATMMGKKFYESDVPRVASSLERIATSFEKIVAQGKVEQAIQAVKAESAPPPKFENPATAYINAAKDPWEAASQYILFGRTTSVDTPRTRTKEACMAVIARLLENPEYRQDLRKWLDDVQAASETKT